MSRKDLDAQKGRNAHRPIQPIPAGQSGGQAREQKPPSRWTTAGTLLVICVMAVIAIPAALAGFWHGVARAASNDTRAWIKKHS